MKQLIKVVFGGAGVTYPELFIQNKSLSQILSGVEPIKNLPLKI